MATIIGPKDYFFLIKSIMMCMISVNDLTHKHFFLYFLSSCLSAKAFIVFSSDELIFMSLRNTYVSPSFSDLINIALELRIFSRNLSLVAWNVMCKLQMGECKPVFSNGYKV